LGILASNTVVFITNFSIMLWMYSDIFDYMMLF
jgi:hypothetical protein